MSKESYKMRIFYTCLPREKDADYECEEICFDIELPYIPRAGDAIAVSLSQEIQTVDEVVYITYETDEFGRICVHLKEPDGEKFSLQPFDSFAAEGWKSA